MKDSIITSFFSDWNGGDKSFADWIRLAADLPELPAEVTHEHDLTKSQDRELSESGFACFA